MQPSKLKIMKIVLKLLSTFIRTKKWLLS